ncbi:MAG: hypothetical protein JST04_01380 [Bdellovibrionales bacterium]|nr:hypothetical protein [Bdellovibrionales bacterium]
MSTVNLFPTLVWRAKMSGAAAKRQVPALVREAKLFREIDAVGARWSRENYFGGYTSYSSITDLAFRSSGFARLKQWIDGEVAKYARALEFDLGRGRLEMSAFWLNIMGKGCHHSFHLHPLSAVSGTFYLQVPKGSGVFKIEDPRLPAFMASPPRKPSARQENRRFFDLVPAPGHLVLFESWLKHEVVANRSAQERISVSFNYDWTSG